MKLFNPCYFCFQAKENIEKFLCQNCTQVFEDYKFYCCPRCSKPNCSGCKHLSDFRSISCLYFYNSIISKIIVNAKDKFNFIFQKIFEEIFYLPVKQELEQILEHTNYNLIFLSSYRKARVFNGYWHPNLFFEKILKEVKIQNAYKFQIINTHYTSKKSTEIYGNPISDNNKHPQTILLCDDVLTTGMSALKCLNAANKQRAELIWDLFTIFRSPQKL